MNIPQQKNREELELLSTDRLLELKDRWNKYLNTEQYLRKEARRAIALIREIINDRVEENRE